MKNALFVDVHNHLHTYMYREALVGRNNGIVSFSLPVCNAYNLSLAKAYTYARSQGFGILYLCTLDGNINFKLACILARASFSRSTYIITNFFAYHKINAFSLKAFALFALLLLSNRLIIITSDPLLETRAYLSFLRKKIVFAPDFCLDRERPDNYREKRFDLPFVIPHNSLVISFMGNINSKKYAVEFVSAIFSLQDHLHSLGIFFVIAGRLSKDISSHSLTMISQLAKKGLVGFIPGYISDDFFYNILSLSHHSWCLQKSFSASSGIFTRSCAWGVPPLVAKGTDLDLISTRFDLGYSFRPSAITADLELFFSAQSNNFAYQQKSINCKIYSAQCSEANYRKTVDRVISELE
jgi:hypothetical protein